MFGRRIYDLTTAAKTPPATSLQPVLGLAKPTMLEIPQPHALDLAISAAEEGLERLRPDLLAIVRRCEDWHIRANRA